MVIDLRLLHYASTLAKHRHFARAAEALDLSQPALSRSIASLEASLGVRLFNRGRQGVEPTAFGERLLARGRQILIDATELERELKLMQGLDVGVLRVGAGTYAADMCVGPALARLATRHPGIRIELTSGDWRTTMQDLLRANLDVAVVELSVADHHPGLHTEPLPRHEAALYCRVDHPLQAPEAPTIEQIFRFPFVSTKLPARVGQSFHQFARTGTVDPDNGDFLPPIRVDNVALAKSIVLASDAIGLAPLGLIAGEMRAGALATLPVHEPWMHTNYGFVYRKDRMLSPAAQGFIAEARAVEAELVELEARSGPYARGLAAVGPAPPLAHAGLSGDRSGRSISDGNERDR